MVHYIPCLHVWIEVVHMGHHLSNWLLAPCLCVHICVSEVKGSPCSLPKVACWVVKRWTSTQHHHNCSQTLPRGNPQQGQTKQYIYYHTVPSADAALHRLSQIECMCKKIHMHSILFVVAIVTYMRAYWTVSVTFGHYGHGSKTCCG